MPECEHCFYICSDGCVLGNDSERCRDFDLEETIVKGRKIQRKGANAR